MNTPIPIEDELRGLAKADLHIHFEGSVTPQLLSELAERHRKSLYTPLRMGSKTITVPDSFDFSATSFADFRNFAVRYLRTTELIRTADDVLTIGVDYLRRSQVENIVASELYFTPSTYVLLGIDLESLFVGCKELESLAARDYNHKLSWIFDIARNSPAAPEETLALALQARKMGVSVNAIGLAGNENCNNTQFYRSVFERARSFGFECIAHAGEGTTPQHILDAIAHLAPSRIGHGISCIEDPMCVHTLIQSQIPLEVCPWSNIAMGITPADEHPLKHMWSSGLDVVIASDDPGIFGKSLTDNYLLAWTLGLALEDLKRLAARSLELAGY